MDSPINIGDITTASIQNRLNDTHLTSTCSSLINSAIYSGQNVIQLTLNLQMPNHTKSSLIILRRVQDSYVNVSQLFSILLVLGNFNQTQIDNFLKNEILSSGQYHGGSLFIDHRNHENSSVRGIWIPYDRAVSLALRFDVYEFTKKLFLIDVHEFDNLPRPNKKLFHELDDDQEEAGLMGSPAKRQKTSKYDQKDIFTSLVLKLAAKNVNFPYTLPIVSVSEDSELTNELKLKLGEVFKLDDENPNLTFKEVKSVFEPFLLKYPAHSVIDIPLDSRGQTALHFASTLASSALVSSFIQLGLNSPVRGNVDGESPLISTVQVTNAMERGNFSELLSEWLCPNLWLFDNKKWTILHHLTYQASKKLESSKFYCIKILEFVSTNEKHLNDLCQKLINSQDEEHGNTALHLAAELESRWFVKILLTLGANVNLSNNRGIRPIDFELVKDVIKDDSFDDHIFELVRTSVEFLKKRLEVNGEIHEIEEPSIIPKPVPTSDEKLNSSNKIFQSIQDLLSNTNIEYETILNSKRQQIRSLNQALHDITIVTANNRFNTKKISERLVYLENLKLQMSNINTKLVNSKLELAEKHIKVVDNLDADKQYIIKPIYDKLVNNESVEDLKEDEDLVNLLQAVPILKARINAYKQINAKIEDELSTLLEYGQLTAKFKKVVSICTGVDVNEVDQLLDGLLEAVEGQN